MSGLDSWIEDIDTNKLMRTSELVKAINLRYCSLGESAVLFDSERGCMSRCKYAIGEKCYPKS